MMNQVVVLVAALLVAEIAAQRLTCSNVRCRAGTTCQMVSGRPRCFCNKICTKIYQPVCGSNNQTYGNICELNADASQSPEEQIVLDYEGACMRINPAGPLCPVED